jgi:hypothetical protein
MDPWPAPNQNSNGYLRFTYDQRRSGKIILQTSVIFTISTQCYTKGPYKVGELQTNLRCCFQHPARPHPLLGGQSVSSMIYLHTLIQALLVDGPKLKNHTVSLVMLKFNLLQKPAQTASHSRTPPHECQQKKNYMTSNSKL